MEQILKDLEADLQYATSEMEKYEDGEDPREYHYWEGYCRGLKRAQAIINR